jgi:hypothetical protein
MVFRGQPTAYHRLSPPVDFETVEPFNEPRAAFSCGD